MSSTIFYKFLHQKVQSTIHFDGTGISVFDLKHEIILQNNLGDGSDFNLMLYHLDQPDSEYDNDQDVIPRSSFVLARRAPSLLRNGKFNNASRYVSGKPRIQRKVQQLAAGTANSIDAQSQQLATDENISEADRIKLMFENQSNAWAQTQDELSTHKMVYNKPAANAAAGGAGAAVNPEDLPPPGYICYRCGGKDHWIRSCPTNTDPNYEGKKITRTTGIPKSYLKTISKDSANDPNNSDITTNENGDLVNSQGNTFMMTDSGDYVVAMADSKTWTNYQQKQENAAVKARNEYEGKILDCIEKESRLEFVNPLAKASDSRLSKLLRAPIVMTPCCNTKSSLKKMSNFSYNQKDLEQALIENDFHCPNCEQDDVYLDLLIRNEQLEKQLEEYIKEKETELEIENPDSLKRGNPDDNASDPSKRQNIGLPLRPDGGIMPPMPFMPMFMPPVPPQFMAPPPPPTK